MKELVRTGYDEIAEKYAASRSGFDVSDYLTRFAGLLRPGSSVLDLGSGTGEPVARFLADRGFAIRGMDVSSRMVATGRANVPEAQFEVRDMTTLSPGELSVDGVVALYSIFHIPRGQHVALFNVLRTFLSENAPILVTMGASEWEGIEDFHGVPMAWSHFGPEQNRSILEEAGFSIVLDEVDHSSEEQHQVLLASAAPPA